MSNSANNELLRKLVEGAGLTQMDALERFNKGIKVRKISASAWKGYFCNPDSKRFRNFSDALLEHAIKVFKTDPNALCVDGMDELLAAHAKK